MTTIDRAPIGTIDRTTARRAGAALALAAGLAIAGFTALGSVFEYPQILEEPTADILALFREHRATVVGWFLILAVSAGLMAPAGIWLGRIAGGRLGRWIMGTGIAAATVQVVGLQRWVTLVPRISDNALDPALRANAEDRFELWHTVLGKAIGETFGYALTATFTILVVIALSRTVLPRWLALTGYAAAVLIATGVVIPVIETASLTNFAGYVGWCAWLLAVAALLFRVPRPTDRPRRMSPALSDRIAAVWGGRLQWISHPSGADAQDNAAHRLPRGEVVQCLACLPERERPINRYAELTGRQELTQDGYQRALVRRRERATTQLGGPGRAGHQPQHVRDAAEPAVPGRAECVMADEHVTTARRQDPANLGERVVAGHVKDEVPPRTAAGEVFHRVVDDPVHAQGA